MLNLDHDIFAPMCFFVLVGDLRIWYELLNFAYDTGLSD